jgi:transposase
MQVVYERCAGIDVHKKTVVVTVLRTSTSGTTSKTTRTFSTMTAELRALAAWLNQEQIEQVAIESTGVYWWPVDNLLEDGHQVTLVNPQHMQAVPGHKTDVKACSVAGRPGSRHGLLRASFIPPRPIRELRELTRYRKTLVQERAQEVNRLHKVLYRVASHRCSLSARTAASPRTTAERDLQRSDATAY